MELVEIGIIHSPYDSDNRPPHQGYESDEVLSLEIFDAYRDALLGLKVGYKIDVLYWADKVDRSILTGRVRGQGEKRGVFALRSPMRPNPILINTCEIVEIEDTSIRVKGMDAFDKSPLLDIKIALDQ